VGYTQVGIRQRTGIHSATGLIREIGGREPAAVPRGGSLSPPKCACDTIADIGRLPANVYPAQMIDLPPAITCVKAVAPSSVLRLSVDGRSDDVENFKRAYTERRILWPIEAEALSPNGYHFIRFRPPVNTAYSEMAWMLSVARRFRLMVSGPSLTPPLCDPDDP
jgi:hypothetical protein